MSASHQTLSRRERQIIDILYRRGKATAADVMHDLPGDPSYSTVRTQLRILEEKGHAVHEADGPRYVYSATVPRHSARRSALRHLVETFFDGSTEKLVTALLGSDGGRLNPDELDRIEERIRKARKDTAT